jgi:hypothetical protein
LDGEINVDDGGDDGGQGKERCFAEAELEIAKEGTTSPPAKAMHEERRFPFFKEKYVDDEATLDTRHQPPIPRPPTLNANPFRNDQATIAAATTTIPTTAAQS